VNNQICITAVFTQCQIVMSGQTLPIFLLPDSVYWPLISVNAHIELWIGNELCFPAATPMFLPSTSAIHSSRKAATGCMFAARFAGRALAARPTTTIPAIAAIKVTGSLGFSPYNIEAAAFPAAIVIPVPTAKPMASKIAASRKTIRTMWLRLAPSAMRTPISFLRWITT
jgi:hypothetical protein